MAYRDNDILHGVEFYEGVNFIDRNYLPVVFESLKFSFPEASVKKPF